MSTQSKSKQAVELAEGAAPRASRIRRDPPAPAAKPKALNAYPTERETWTVVVGVILFALAITIIIFGVSDITSK